MISTFGSFSMAKLGIRSSQQGLQITGNNISNINTNGYTRQRINQVSLYNSTADRYSVSTDVRMGMGALVTSVTQIRDPYLDIRYRNEACGLGFYDEKMGNLEELKRVLDEVSKDGIHTGFEKIRTQLQNLSKNPNAQENDGLVRSACQELISLLHKYSADLKTQKESALQGFGQNVDQVNDILTKIRDLNTEIRKSQIHGDNALELVDNRNMLIDQLAEMTKIKVTYTKEQVAGGIFVDKLTIEMDAPGQDPATRPVLIDGEFANKLQISPLDANGKPDVAVENYDIHLQGLTNKHDETPLFVKIKEQMDALNDLTGSMQKVNVALADVNTKIEEWKNSLTPFNENDFVKTVTPPETSSPYEKKLKELTDTVTKAREDYQKATQPDEKKAALEKLKEAQGQLDKFKKFDQQKQTLDQQQTDLQTKFEKQFDALNSRLKEHGLNPVKAGPNADGTFHVTVTGAAVNETLLNGTQKPPQFSVTEKNGGLEMQINGKPFGEKTPQDVEKDAHKNDQLKDKDWYGVLKADLEYLNGKGEFDTPATEVRGIAYYQRSLDTLAQTFAQTMNKLNNTDPDPANWDKNLFDAGDPNDPDKKITASNISISAGWKAGTTHITATKDPAAGSGDNSNILSMIQALNGNQTFNVLDKDGNVLQDNGKDRVFYTGSFEGMFTNMNAVLGSDMSSTNTMLNNASSSTNDRAVARDNVSSVDLNEEGINLVQYQKSFAAACRVMTTLDEMLQTLLSIKN